MFPVPSVGSHLNIKCLFVKEHRERFPRSKSNIPLLGQVSVLISEVKKTHKDSHILEYLRKWELVNEVEFKRPLERQKLDICWHSSA